MVDRFSHPDESIARKVPGNDPVPIGPESRSQERESTQGNPDPQHNIDIAHLRSAMEWSQQELKSFRKKHTEAIKHYAGNRYGNSGLEEKKALNMLKLAVGIWKRQLVSQTPRSLVITKVQELKASAYEMEIILNNLLDKMQFGDSLSEVVSSALFTIGIMRVGIAEEYLPKSAAVPSLGGQPYAEPVLFEDWIHDMNARRLSECQFMGNKYRVPYDDVIANQDFNADAKDQLVAGLQNRTMDANQKRESDIGSQNPATRTELFEMVELWDIYIPSKKITVTIADQTGNIPLRVQQWEGPESGPYKILAFGDVPGSILPAAPAQDMFDMQDLFTKLVKQLGEQAIRQKTITTAMGAAVDDGTADRVASALDGEVIRTEHPDGVREVKYGGVDAPNFEFTNWVRQMISYSGGNLDTMGGLSQQADTLGQEKLLSSSSSNFLLDLQAKVLSFVSEVLHDLGWYIYTNPVDTYEATKEIEDFGEIPFANEPSDRSAEFYEYNIDVQPYSLQMKTPQERLAAIVQIMQTTIIPLAPQLMEWGMPINFKAFLELISKYGDLPEIPSLVVSQSPLQGTGLVAPSASRSSERPLQAASTSRHYTRQNIRGVETQESQDAKTGKAIAKSSRSNQE